MKIIYCIIVTFNGMDWIDKCLQSVLRSSSPAKLIIIDNGSNDGTASFIKENYPCLILIENANNAGFGQANNQGIRIAIQNKADFVLLLNQDAWLEHDTLQTLLDTLLNNPEFGILSPLHLNGPGTHFDPYFLKYLEQAAGKNSPLARFPPLSDQPKLISADFVNAAAWLVSLDCLRHTGGFDPIFFHYGEDINYCQRALLHGWKIGIDTDARICHDRESRLSLSEKNMRKRIKNDFIHFLNQVCDIRQQNYRQIIVKRVLRYGGLMMIRLFLLDLRGFRYNYGMTKKILNSFYKIALSRKIAKSSHEFPFLY